MGLLFVSFRLVAGLSSFGGSITGVGSAGAVGVGGIVGHFSLSGGIGFAGAGVTVAEVEAIGVSACMVVFLFCFI